MGTENKKKKHGCLIAVGVVVVLGVIGAALGGNQNSDSTTGSSSSITSSSITSSTDSSASNSTGNQSSEYFANNELVTEDIKIVITDYKIIQPGETGNEYGDKPVIAFWYDTTNVSGKAGTNATTAWMTYFEAIQDNDPNVVNTLNVGSLPDNAFLDSQLQEIKQGGTISNAVAYELDDTTTPVTLKASLLGLNDLGEQTFEIAQ